MKYINSMVIILAFSVSVWALPPQIELERLLLQAKSAVDSQDYALAKESLDKAEKLGLNLPDNFYYYSGKANAHTHNYERSRAMFERYLEMKGTKGKYYQDSLEYINAIDAAIKKRDAEKEVEKLKKLQLYNEQLSIYNKKVEEVETYNGRERENKVESCIKQKKKACENSVCPAKNFYSSEGRNGCIDFSCRDYYEFKIKCLNEYPEISMPTPPSPPVF